MSTSSIVNTLGAGSGIDVKSLAQSLVDAEKTPRKERIDAKIAKSEAKITGYSAVKYALSELKNAFAKLNDASDFSSIKPSNTQPSAFGITASSMAEAGSYSIEVLQTALAQRTASSSFADRATALNVISPATTGTTFELNLAVGGVSKGNISVTTPTPAGMVSAINGAKLGVTAQLINTGNGFQVVVTGETGTSKNFSLTTVGAPEASITSETDSPLVVTADTNATAVSVNYTDAEGNTINLPLIKGEDNLWRPEDEDLLTAANMTVQVDTSDPLLPFFNQNLQTATDARFKVNGLEVTRSSNTVSDVIDGVTLDLYTNTTGAARLDLNRDTAGIKDNIKGLVTAYNDFEETLKILGDRASEVEEFGGVLAGESLLQSVRTQVRAMITSNSSTPGTTIQAARDVGLSIDRYGKLTLDDSKLDTALQNNFAEVSTMFSAGTNNQSIYSPAPAGLAGSAIKSIEKMLLSTGLIDTQSKSATTQIAKYKEELTALDERMEKLMTRYMSQFSVMESIVGNSNSMRSSLKGTFESMLKSYGN
jgi:flagellar hook-associated protein 2